MKNNITKRESAKFYRDIAKFFKENPKKWGTGRFFNPVTGEFCVIGAGRQLVAAKLGRKGYESEFGPDVDVRWHVESLRRFKAEYQILGEGLVTFNDKADSVEKVINGLRAIARHIEHGGG